MSTKRKAEDQLNFKNYLDKKSRVYGNENIDYDDEEEMFENGCHPIQKDTAAAFKKLDRLMQQNQQQTQQQNQQQNQQQPQSSFQNSILMNTQSTARTSTQMLNLTTQNESFTVPELPEFNTQYNTQFLEEVSKEWQVSQAIINDLTELTDSRDSSGNRLSQNTTTQLDEDIIGLTPKICHVLTTARGLKNLYAWQKRCLRQPNVKHFQSLCYQVPTGGGKSLIAEILILKQIFQKQKDAVLVLPYVSLVQEKVASFSMLGTKLNFLVEEYAAGKGSLPPMNRRKTNTLYICTIEKGSALIDSLMFESRLSEIGIVVVDEIHMLYEVGKRGGTLEALVTKVKLHKETKIQIIGMSATIPNLTKVSEFLQGSKFENSERPVVLQHYVKDGGSIFKARVYNNKTGIEFDFCRSVGGNQKDVDGVMDLVSEVTEKEGGSVIVFCATKRQCESLAISYRFIGYKQTHRDGRADLLNSYANAIDRLSATERDIVTQTFGVTTHTIATKQFGMSTISTGFTKPKLKKNPSASVIGEQEKINISTEKNDAEKDSVLVCNSSTVDGSEAPSLSVSSAEPSPMQSSYKNLDKVRKMLIDAAKSIPKKPTYDSEELDRNLIACLAVYECRIKQKENYKVSRGDVQQLCTAVSTNCSTLARFCEIIHTGDQALSILQKKVEHDFPENEEMSVMVQASHTLWILSPILRNLTSTLRYGSLGELVELLDIPSIGMGRAKQLQRAGFTNLEKLANACCDDLVSKVEFLSRKVAMKILSAARNKIKDRLSVIEESFLTVQKETKFQGYDINQ